MEKILVSLEVPVIERTFEVFVPPSLPIGDLAAILGKSVEDMTGGHYRSSGREFLCLRENNEVLSQVETARSYGIKNGDRLLLI